MTSTWGVFLPKLTLLYIARIEQENNVDYDFTEDVRTFLMYDLRSRSDKYSSWLSTIRIDN